MDRRIFLSLAAAGATARAFQKAPVGIGFLGASHSHAAGKLAVARMMSDLRLVGVCEPDPKIQETLRNRSITLMSRDQLLAAPEIGIIAVESAVRDHATDGLAVLEAGKHLHLEKAPADKMAPFEKMVAVARKKNLRMQVGYMWRYNPGIIKAVQAARNGWLGSVYLVKASIGNQLPADGRPAWAEFPGGTMFELGCHMIDSMVRLMGPPGKVTPVLHKDGNFNDTLRDNTLAVLEWKGALGIVESSNMVPSSGKYRFFEIHGSNGRAIVNPVEAPVFTIDLDKAAGPYEKGVQTIPIRTYQRYIEDFFELASAVRGEAKLRVTLDEELMVEEAVLRCSGMYEKS